MMKFIVNNRTDAWKKLRSICFFCDNDLSNCLYSLIDIYELRNDVIVSEMTPGFEKFRIQTNVSTDYFKILRKAKIHLPVVELPKGRCFDWVNKFSHL